MATGTIILASIYNMFITQREVYRSREQVAEMQHNARTAMDMMVREIRLAGLDPEGTSGAGIVGAEEDVIQFTMDLNGDGNLHNPDDSFDPNENVTYSLYDSGRDGDKDLGRSTGTSGTRQPVAENIEDLSFTYTVATDDGDITTHTPDPAVLDQIRTVHISLTARTSEADANFPENDGYRTVTLTTHVTVRNFGL